MHWRIFLLYGMSVSTDIFMPMTIFIKEAENSHDFANRENQRMTARSEFVFGFLLKFIYIYIHLAI